MNGLFPRMLFPNLNNIKGMKLSANAMKPNKLLAHWKPNVRYILWVASGKNAAMKFSRNAMPAMALAAYFAYASTTYVVTPAVLQNIPKPIKASDILGTIHDIEA